MVITLRHTCCGWSLVFYTFFFFFIWAKLCEKDREALCAFFFLLCVCVCVCTSSKAHRNKLTRTQPKAQTHCLRLLVVKMKQGENEKKKTNEDDLLFCFFLDSPHMMGGMRGGNDALQYNE